VRVLLHLPSERPGEQGGTRGQVPDETTTGHISRARGGGQPLEGALQEQIGAHMGYDFSRVRVHSGPESDELNQPLSAKAFTTGQDIFLRSGDHDPGSSGGRDVKRETWNLT
jgi:hypothetical protein